MNKIASILSTVKSKITITCKKLLKYEKTFYYKEIHGYNESNVDRLGIQNNIIGFELWKEIDTIIVNRKMLLVYCPLKEQNILEQYVNYLNKYKGENYKWYLKLKKNY